MQSRLDNGPYRPSLGRLGRLTLAAMVVVTLLLSLATCASASFGIASFDGSVVNQDGSPDTHAGSHPYAISTSIDFDTVTESFGKQVTEESVKDVKVELPPGYVGNPAAIPRCREDELVGIGVEAGCPPDTQVGISILNTGGFLSGTWNLGVYNMVPPAGVPAEFGMNVGGVLVHLIARVRTGGDYGLTVEASNLNQTLVIDGTTMTFWGVPMDPSHDFQRCAILALANEAGQPECATPTSVSIRPQAFLTTPTSCAGPQTFTVHADSWTHPGAFQTSSFVTHDNGTPPKPVGQDGCEALNFEPVVKISPDTAQADTPAGLTVDVKMPNEGLTSPTGRASAEIENTKVALPQGVAVNPGQAAGLTSCPAGQDGLGADGPPECPLSSQVGIAQITTPLLEDKMEGGVYVLPSNPPDLKLLVAAAADGVNVKLVGDVRLNRETGQLTTTFDQTPPLPFSDLKISFSGGAQAALVTPPTCGVYETTSDFTPWSAPGGADAFPTDIFAISSGPGGSACASSLPFAPTLIAGSTSDQAGGYTGFSMLLQRGDGEQRVSSLRFVTPQGLLGRIDSVPLCADQQAAAGTCPAQSQIGHTVVESGPGPYPLVVPQPGAASAPIYLTGPYKGAPYGLAIVVPVVVGPFDLGTVVVRASIAVDPVTSRLAITTDPLPSILDGVPTDLRTIDAVIDRAAFMFNPTNCAPMSFGGTATSSEGASARLSSRFQVGSCQSLKFKPGFRAWTSARTSRKDGASLRVRLTYPAAQMGTQVNIKSVKVELPRALPSRLTTLNHACPASVFNHNPSECPSQSRVGFAKALTPVLPSPLQGPAYFVSHGGQKFPELIAVIQGDGVTIDLAGETFISRAGITSSTFKQVPDVPVSSFELTLPQGQYSALATNGKLCKPARTIVQRKRVTVRVHGHKRTLMRTIRQRIPGSLTMPTVFTAQNGEVLHQDTKVEVVGCSMAKHKRHKA